MKMILEIHVWRRILSIVSFLCVIVLSGEAQGVRFRKIVENKYENDWLHVNQGNTIPGSYCFDSKTELEKLFFGDLNAEVEYFMVPSFSSPYGLRIMRDSADASYVIHCKRIVNMDQVDDQVREEFPLAKGFTSLDELDAHQDSLSKLSEDEKEQRMIRNQVRNAKEKRARLARYEIRTLSTPISDSFAKNMHAKFAFLIDHFTMKGVPAMIGDGYVVTLRCVVGDEVWTLTLDNPGIVGNEVNGFSDLCRQIITDIEAGTFDEANYIKLLKN